jgi:hypothetical protein
VRDIADRIFNLPVIQWPTRPIGEAGTLVDLHIGISRHQIGVTDLLTQPQGHGGDLRVEQRLRRFAGQIVDDLQILPAGMEHFQHRFFDQQLQKGRKIQIGAFRVDGRGLVRTGDLHKAKIRVIGTLAHEFGIHRDKVSGGPTGAKFLQCRGVSHQRVNQHGARYLNLAA